MKNITINNRIYPIKECPLCGHLWQDKYDFLYPQSERWEAFKDFESKENFEYKSSKENPYENKWQLNCNENEGGCGLTMVAKTLEEVVSKWNLRKVK